jgi:hypothetical protein
VRFALTVTIRLNIIFLAIVPDSVSVIGVVMWRFATLDRNHLDFFGMESKMRQVPEAVEAHRVNGT